MIIPTFVKFRKFYPQISTNYATHKVYYYPAAFIPQVVRYCIDSFSNEKDTVLDMFAGGGTVGVESFIKNRDFILIDINPILPELVKLKTWIDEIDFSNLKKEINKIFRKTPNRFIPDWKNVNYWYHSDILGFLSNLWGNLYSEKFNYYLILKFSLLYVSKKFSYADDSVPKLYSSKKKKQKIIEFMKDKLWKERIKEEFVKRVKLIVNAISELRDYAEIPNTSDCTIIVGDAYKTDINTIKPIDLIVTSPPYLQAQEYIRSIKLDLYWSKYREKDIKEISKLEIPYRKVDLSNRIYNSAVLNQLRKEINLCSLDKKKQELFESYFFYTIKSIERFLPLLKEGGKVCIFVGSPKFNGIKVNIWEVFADYFSNKLEIVDVLADPIISRKLGYKRKNNNPNGIDYEYLLIFCRRD